MRRRPGRLAIRQSDGVTGVEVREVRSDGLVGWLCCPQGAQGAGVLALGGSDGGIPLHTARLLAEAGFCGLALGYFGAPGLPGALVNIRLEYIKTALDCLRTQPRVSSDRVGVIGVSKGAELALVSAATFPDAIAAVVAYAPSCVCFPGITVRGEGRRSSSWTYEGEPLPFVPYPRRMRPALGPRGLALAPIYQRALDQADAATVASAAIRIEESDASILLLSGGRDRVWPSSAMAEALMGRLADAGKGDRGEHLDFAGAGHSFMPWRPNLRSRLLVRALDEARLAGFGTGLDLGGRPSANRQALQDGWARVIPFLREHLGSREGSGDAPPVICAGYLEEE